jgi:hypothetical protein
MNVCFLWMVMAAIALVGIRVGHIHVCCLLGRGNGLASA